MFAVARVTNRNVTTELDDTRVRQYISLDQLYKTVSLDLVTIGCERNK